LTLATEKSFNLDLRTQTSKSRMEEPSLYSENTDGPDSEVKKLKRSMTLDFNSSSSTKSRKLAAVLASPDLNMLKLASPELEKMIIQANGMVTTTPTPTQFVFPKFVTEEQEAYARGFVDALAKLQNSAAVQVAHHRVIQNQTQIRPVVTQDTDRPSYATLSVPSALSQSATVPSASSAAVALPLGSLGIDLHGHLQTAQNEVATTTSLPGGRVPLPLRASVVTPPPPPPSNSKTNIPTTVSANNIPTTADSYNIHLTKVKDEPQTVPCLGSPPPLSPINMASQEKVKLERKRARNRVAARKCRTRKLERISRLEDRIKDLKDHNHDLASNAINLRDQVTKLKQRIVEHVSSGCQMSVHNVSFGDHAHG